MIKNNILQIKTLPNASKTEIKAIEEDIIKLAVAAPPEKNRANRELLKFLKKEYNIRARIKSGATSREKILEIL